ncbi:arginine--tRNA ligase [Dissulfurispira thermophila]|uniref:Arginine--tRNA ligase n=1 Tax=Dissulfurispira thermophila TaxID=2715679 RepID=A0A7G1H2G8_9BACT|nr:arginine--tRNA ligase [Dissulfurispira thermophila]BCB95907.1 arginine--tRNA ligase [Dissulfurispira thermophila]
MEKILREIISKAIKDQGIDARNIEIEIPKEQNFGDLSTPAAMGLSRTLRKPPRKIAEDIINSIENKEIFEKIDIAGPGFINFTFSKKYLCSELKELLEKQDDFLIEDIGKGKRVQIEFVSANPTGPLHLGHGRGAALGAALSNLLQEAGYKVEREFYINDAGRQITLLGMSVFAKYKQLLGQEYPFPEDGYRGEYIEELAREFKEQKIKDRDQKTEELIDEITEFSYKKMLSEIRKDLEDFGVFFDSWQSERELYQESEVEKSIEELKKLGYIYEKDRAIWFKSTAFKDDKDRVVIKKEGDYTYFAPDIAYHRKKAKKGFDEIIDIWGADHHGYVLRMQAVMQAFGYPEDYLKVLLVQMVTLLRGGKPVQMSKRAGEFITLREVIDEIGADTTKFMFLTRRPDSHLEVDIEIAKAQSSENPVYYVQYAHARINSIFEKASQDVKDLTNFNGELFNKEEIRIIKKLLLYPMMFKNAAIAHEPHRITFYLQELAGMFHPYYHKHRVVSEDPELTRVRLAMCKAIQIVIRHGLKILGVKAPERM